MPRYIDANAAKSALLGWETDPTDDEIEYTIDNIPTADVAEIVRCKDCKWWEARTRGSTIGRCKNPLNGLYNEYSDFADYCSYGERKETDG